MNDADLDQMMKVYGSGNSAPTNTPVVDQDLAQMQAIHGADTSYNPKVYPRTPGVPTIEIIGGANSPKKEAPVAPVSNTQRLMQGMWNDPTTALGQIYAHLTQSPEIAKGVDQQITSDESKYQAGRQAAGDSGVDGLRMVGNAAISLAVPMARAASIPGVMMGGALSGGIMGGGMQPVNNGGDFANEKFKQTALSALGGATLPTLLTGIAGAIGPKITSAAQKLRDAGVPLNLGSAFGGTIQKLEQGATSIPLLGDLIKNANREGFAKAANHPIEQALAPIGEKLPADIKGSQDAVGYAYDKLGDAYRSVLPNLNVKVDPQWKNEMGTIVNMAQNLPADKIDQFQRILTNEVTSRFTPYQTMSGETMKNVDSELGNLARNYLFSKNYDERKLGSAIRATQDSLRDMVTRNNPAYAAQLDKINQGYSAYKVVEDAANRMTVKQDYFNPSQLYAAGKASTGSKAARASGQGQFQDYAKAWESAMGNKIPDSGTPFRSMVGALALGGAAHINPLAAASAAATTIPYLPGVRNLTSAWLAQQNALPAANALRQIAPYTSSLLAPAFASNAIKMNQ